MPAAKTKQRENFAFTSSVRDDVWHPKTNDKAYEWWYFDALSDDGREAVVIIFLDNFIFSPRYNSLAGVYQSQSTKAPDTEPTAEITAPHSKVPAVAFVYYCNGKPCYRAYNEYPPEEFSASRDIPTCRIGENSFNYEEAPYGSGYTISINAKLRKNLQIEAHFEWVSVESDFTPDERPNLDNNHFWNLVAPRSDVTGRITVTNAKGRNLNVIHFRGSGYHDHNLDNRWLPETVSKWQWGRAHFADATAVFYRYLEYGSSEEVSRIYLIRNGELEKFDAAYADKNHTRDVFGIKYPTALDFSADQQLSLKVEQSETIDSSFFYLRFLSRMTLTVPGGREQTAIGITEHLAPKTLKHRWLDFLINMRIGRNGKGAFLP